MLANQILLADTDDAIQHQIAYRKGDPKRPFVRCRLHYLVPEGRTCLTKWILASAALLQMADNYPWATNACPIPITIPGPS